MSNEPSRGYGPRVRPDASPAQESDDPTACTRCGANADGLDPHAGPLCRDCGTATALTDGGRDRVEVRVRCLREDVPTLVSLLLVGGRSTGGPSLDLAERVTDDLFEELGGADGITRLAGQLHDHGSERVDWNDRVGAEIVPATEGDS